MKPTCRYCTSSARYRLTFTDIDRRTQKRSSRSALACETCGESFKLDPSVQVEQLDDETLVVDVADVAESRDPERVHIAVEEMRLRIANSLQVWLTLRPEQALRLAEYDDAGPREVAAAQPLELRVLRALYRLIEEHLNQRSN